MTDVIRKTITLKAPVARVWRALTDHREFGTWFRVALDGPFTVGEETTGRMTYPGFEGWPWLSTTIRMEEPRLFIFTWPHAEGRDDDLRHAPTTRVQFELEAAPGGTLLTVTETGFDALPEERRVSVMRGNESGWEIQLRNVQSHVEG
jgi:uncharacterized protein YndB with AHSA1/START domain